MHTPGPWKWDAEGTRGFPVLYGGKDGGFAVLGLPGDRSYLSIESADAKLIEQAPELARQVAEFERLKVEELGKFLEMSEEIAKLRKALERYAAGCSDCRGDMTVDCYCGYARAALGLTS